ncbi:MAG: nucleotide-binding protein [Lachnospiraceae bacterium]|jgi:predicted nucleotide-binding protein|nr:nucleotide-binding protein [Lachnospiraceae bacterium]
MVMSDCEKKEYRKIIYENLYLHFFNREIYRGIFGEKADNLKMNHMDLLTTLMICGLNPMLASFSAFAETIDILDEGGKIYRELYDAGHIVVCGETLNVDLNIGRKQDIYEFDSMRYAGYFGLEVKSLEKIIPTALKMDVTDKIEEAFMEDSWQQIYNVVPTQNDRRVIQKNEKLIREIIKNRNDRAITKSLISDKKYGKLLSTSMGRTLSGFYVYDYREFGGGDIVTGLYGLIEYDFLGKHFPHHDYQILRKLLDILGFPERFEWKEFESGIKWYPSLEHREFSLLLHMLLGDMYKKFSDEVIGKQTIQQKRIGFIPFIREKSEDIKLKNIDFRDENFFIQAIENLRLLTMVVKDDERGVVIMNQKKVFVVTGRNEELRLSVFNLLRALKLEPMEWMEVIRASGETSPYLSQAIMKSIEEAGAVVVIMTPEEDAQLNEKFWSEDGDDKIYKQPRPNVIFEAGLALGMKENKTIILQFGELRIFSDILGKHVTKYRGKDKENDFKLDLLEKLKIAGCQCEAGRDYYNIKIDY